MMKGLPSRIIRDALIGAVVFTAGTTPWASASAQQSADGQHIIAMAFNEECVDPSVAAEPENLDKAICIPAPAAPAGNPNWFKRGFFQVTDGRVGYHMTSHNGFYDKDVPPECGHDAGNSYMLEAEVEGDLPPGLTYSPERAQFEGTPRQPGDWDVTVVYSHMRCRGSDLDFGDRRIPVHFHINP